MITKERMNSYRKQIKISKAEPFSGAEYWMEVAKLLLDEHEELEARYKANLSELKQVDANSAAKDREYKKIIEAYEAERNSMAEAQDYEAVCNARDNYKRRSEALERAIYQNCNYCALYLQDKLTDDCWERRNTGIFDFGCKGWQFDEARFSAGGDGE